MNFIPTRWVNPFPLQAFVKNPIAFCCVVEMNQDIYDSLTIQQFYLG